MIGDKIKQLRQEKNMTQAQLAAEMQMNNNTLASYERNLREPKSDIIAQFCRYFNVTSDYLLGISVYKNPTDKAEREGLRYFTDTFNEMFMRNETVSNSSLAHGNYLDLLYSVVTKADELNFKFYFSQLLYNQVGCCIDLLTIYEETCRELSDPQLRADRFNSRAIDISRDNQYEFDKIIDLLYKEMKTEEIKKHGSKKLK